MNNITMFESEIIDNIYGFLANVHVSRRAFGCTCRRFRNICKENEKHQALAKFVSKNYIVCASNLNSLPLWQQLKMAKVILVGETHNIPRHRKIFAQLTHRIWMKDVWALLTEGSGKEKLGYGQIKYLEDDIAEVHESWDIDCPVLFDLIEGLMRDAIVSAGNFLNMRDEKNPLLFNLKIEKLLSNFKDLSIPVDAINEKIEQMKIYLQSAQIEKDQRSIINYIIYYRSTKAFVTQKICGLTYDLINECEKSLQNIVHKSLMKRDQEMVVNIGQQITRGKKVLVIAGKTHVIQRENSPSDLLEKKKLPFLSVIPKQPIHHAADTPLRISPREQLKSCNINSWNDLHHYYDLGPGDIILAELQDCIDEATKYNSLAQSLES